MTKEKIYVNSNLLQTIKDKKPNYLPHYHVQQLETNYELLQKLYRKCLSYMTDSHQVTYEKITTLAKFLDDTDLINLQNKDLEFKNNMAKLDEFIVSIKKVLQSIKDKLQECINYRLDNKKLYLEYKSSIN